MPERKLEEALRVIDDAQNLLNKVKLTIPDDMNIHRAIRELNEAESLVRKAIREVKYN